MKYLVLVLMVVLVAIPMTANAHSQDGKPYSIGLSGLGSSLGGIGFKYDMNQNMAIHGIVGNGAAGQLRYVFHKIEYWDFYAGGFGGVRFNDDDAAIVGGCIGVDLNLRIIFNDNVPLSFGLELDAGNDGIGIGGTLHWNF